MRPGYVMCIHRFASFSVHPVPDAAKIGHLIAGRRPAFVAAIFFGFVLAAQAQESVQEVALPPWSEPTLPSTEQAPSTQSASLPSAPEPWPSTPAEPLPSAAAPLPSSEEAFSASADPWSSSPNYTAAHTSVIPAPAAGGPYGGFSTKNVAAAEGAPSGEPRRFHYGFLFTVRGVWDDNIFISHTDRKSDYY